MATKFHLHTELARLREDYAAHNGGVPFKHFFCPILYEDREAELCGGHVINECISSAARQVVVQRKDIDGFYGSLVESEYITAIEAKGKTVSDVLSDDKLRRKLRSILKFEFDGTEVDAYEVRGHGAPKHPKVHIEQPSGDFLTYAMKISPEELPKTAKLQISFERNYTMFAVAATIKAAHLTMFAQFGYHYVNSAAGAETARILRTFYEENRDLPRCQQTANIQTYFSKYAGMLIPLLGYEHELVKGSVEDRRFIVCVGSSGHFYALGVLVRVGHHMSIVLLAPDRAELMDTYLNLTANWQKNSFRYHIADFVPETATKPAHWNGFKDLFVFDPDALPNATA
jgi:hypothetical protein